MSCRLQDLPPKLREQAIAQLAKNAKPQTTMPSVEATMFFVRRSTDEERLNKTEREYLSKLMVLGKQWIGVQNITLKIANDCRLTCDFAFLQDGRLVLVDVKGGFWREDAKIKIKSAARLFPWIEFRVAHKRDGAWTEESIKP